MNVFDNPRVREAALNLGYIEKEHAGDGEKVEAAVLRLVATIAQAGGPPDVEVVLRPEAHKALAERALERCRDGRAKLLDGDDKYIGQTFTIRMFGCVVNMVSDATAAA